jgi:hypothetical protein
MPLNNAMAANPVILLFLVAVAASAQPVSGKQSPPKFMGREVTVTDPGTDDDGFSPKGPATVCVEGPPRRQCYTMPKDFGRSPEATLVQVEKGMPALLFSAESGGVSGWEIHFALLHQGQGNGLEDLFLSNLSTSNQSEHEFWNLPAFSDAPIFATADYVWGPDEAHYDEHRYIVSTYARRGSTAIDGHYYLEDRYMTTRKYDIEKGNILSSEKPEILARLRRVRAENQRHQRTP